MSIFFSFFRMEKKCVLRVLVSSLYVTMCCSADFWVKFFYLSVRNCVYVTLFLYVKGVRQLCTGTMCCDVQIVFTLNYARWACVTSNFNSTLSSSADWFTGAFMFKTATSTFQYHASMITFIVVPAQTLTGSVVLASACLFACSSHQFYNQLTTAFRTFSNSPQ
jgi:hypothetical protein